MESATILTPPSTGLSGILLSVRTQSFLKDQNMKKYKKYIDAREKFYQLHTETMTPVGT